MVIGGGQAGLAAGFYLRRTGLEPHRDYVILDANSRPGGAWQHGWESLRLFSPSEYSALPVWQMPVWRDGFPPVGHLVNYLTRYEERYALPVLHDVRVTSVRHDFADDQGFVVHSDAGRWRTDAVISATGRGNSLSGPATPGPATSGGGSCTPASTVPLLS